MDHEEEYRYLQGYKAVEQEDRLTGVEQRLDKIEVMTYNKIIQTKKATMPSENVFAKEKQEREQVFSDYAVKWGFSDLDALGQIEVKVMTEKIIREKNVTDDEVKQNIVNEVKRQYLEYKEHRGY
ncbi:MAG TPA: hypothetical protein VHV10_05250 [Ktedonobacteraceae bacterium]|nr:hypothetical protein [Ktedonobacteraceae bacterium]